MQQDKLRSKSRSGQSLVEAMIAISLLLVGFMGAITLINRSIGLTRVVADQYVGTYLAAEGIEVVKSLVDANYLASRPFHDGFESCVNTCEWQLQYDSTWESGRPQAYTGRTFWYDPLNGTYTYTPFGTETSFTRKVNVTLGGPTGNELMVESRVEWRSRGGGTAAVTLEDRFYDWYLLDTGTTTSTISTSSTSTAP